MRVPYFKQETNVFCGPACVQMVLSYFGKPFPSQTTLARVMKTDLVGENGTQHRVLADYLRSKGYIARASRSSTFSDMEQALSEGYPVIVHYLEPSQNDDHYAVVTRLTKTHITLNDPWNGRGLTYTRPEFLKRWKDKVGTYIRWMLTVRPT